MCKPTIKKCPEQLCDKKCGESSKSKSSGETAALKAFQSKVALALLSFTGNLEDEQVERRLASALLFLTHLSSEITRGFADGDEQIASGLLTDAIIESRHAYPNIKTKFGRLFH